MQIGERHAGHAPPADVGGKIAQHVGVAGVVHVPVVIDVGIDDFALTRQGHVLYMRYPEAQGRVGPQGLLAAKGIAELVVAQQRTVGQIHQRPDRDGLGHRLPAAQNAEAAVERQALPVADPGLHVNPFVRQQGAQHPDGYPAEQKGQPALVPQAVQVAHVALQMLVGRFLHVHQNL